MIGGHGFFQLIQQKAVFIAFHRHNLGLIELHALQIAQEGGVFHKNHITRVNHGFAEQIHGLGRAGHRQHRRNLTANLLLHIGLQTLQERRIPFRCPILQNGLAILLEHLMRNAIHRFIRQCRRRRIAPCKGDHARLGNHFENFTDCAARDTIEPMSEPKPFHVHTHHPFQIKNLPKP